MISLLLCTLMTLPPEPAPIPVVLSSDLGCEIDDQFALIHLALSPRFDFRLVVTSHAPNLAKPATESAAKQANGWLLKLKPKHGRPLPKVVAGSSEPLAGEGQPRKGPGAEALLKAAEGFDAKNRLQVVMIGAATDVASALLIDPSWADRVRVVSMGFSDWPGGGDPWNVKNDPIAWRTILRSRVPLVVATEKVCKEALVLSGDDLAKRFGALGEPGPSLVAFCRPWLKEHADMVKNVSGKPDAWPIWDPSTVAFLLGKAETKTYPRPDLRDDLSFAHEKPNGSIEWVTKIDGEGLWKDLAELMK